MIQERCLSTNCSPGVGVAMGALLTADDTTDTDVEMIEVDPTSARCTRKVYNISCIEI